LRYIIPVGRLFVHATMLQYTEPRLDPQQTNQVRSFRVFDLGLVIML
jgi:hypothetical protein